MRPMSSRHALCVPCRIFWDVLLLGPQVRYLEKEYKPLCEQKGKGFGVIPMQTYGRMDGKGCMELARKAAANK